MNYAFVSLCVPVHIKTAKGRMNINRYLRQIEEGRKIIVMADMKTKSDERLRKCDQYVWSI